MRWNFQSFFGAHLMSKANLSTIFLLCLAAMLLSGCFATRSDVFLSDKKTVPVLSTAKSGELIKSLVEDNKGVVYIYREPMLFAGSVNMAVAIDDLVVGRLGTGTYYRLSLTPGKHKASFFMDTIFNVTMDNISVDPFMVVEGRETFYVMKYDSWLVKTSIKLIEVSKAEAMVEINKYQHAAFDLTGFTVPQYFEMKKNYLAQRNKSKTDASLAQTSQSASSDGFLEGLATVLFIGLIILGAAYGQQPGVTTAPIYAPPMALISEMKTSKGLRYQLSNNGDLIGSAGDKWSISGRTITNKNNGATYEINKNGSTVYGDRGQSYRVDPSSKTLLGADGTACGIGSGGVVGCGSQYKYQGKSGTAYQYDLSKPLDQGRYSTDVPAQIRDSINTKPGVNADRDWGQRGGGVQR